MSLLLSANVTKDIEPQATGLKRHSSGEQREQGKKEEGVIKDNNDSVKSRTEASKQADRSEREQGMFDVRCEIS